MIKFTIDVDPSQAAICDAIYRIAAEYGSSGAVHDRFTLIVEESNATFCQRAIDDKAMRMYRIELIVLPAEMMARGNWCLVRSGREGVWTHGAS